VSLPGCGVYEAETGDAFGPWSFPGDERVPERVVARAALLASSPHNTQPWALGIEATKIELRARFDRNLGTMDGLLREMHTIGTSAVSRGSWTPTPRARTSGRRSTN
jgi:hypothetical protein